MRIIAGEKSLPPSLPKAFLDQWGEKIVLLCRGVEITENLDLARCIYVTDGLKNPEVLDAALIPGFQHVVQSSRKDVLDEVRIAALMIESFSEYLEDPVSAILGKGTARVFKKPFHDSSLKKEMLSEVERFLATVPNTQVVQENVLQIVDELYTNAIFDAPIDPGSGFRYRDEPRMRTVRLPKAEEATLFVGAQKDFIVVSVRDPFGSLSIEKLLVHIQAGYQRGIVNMMRRDGGGAGIGCHVVFELSSSIYIGVEPERSTVFSCKLPLGASYRQTGAMFKNLHFRRGTTA